MIFYVQYCIESGLNFGTAFFSGVLDKKEYLQIEQGEEDREKG